MGDARRASFEERKAAAIARQKAGAERKAIMKSETEATKTPEQKLRRSHAMALMMAPGMMGAYSPSIMYRDGEHNFKLQYRNKR